jgi:hypothetical protein
LRTTKRLRNLQMAAESSVSCGIGRELRNAYNMSKI